MVGKIIFFVSCFMCAVPFLIISIFDKESITPIPFWSGSEKKLKEELKDIKGYNAKMSKLYKKVALTFVLCGVVGLIHSILGFAALICTCTIGFYYIYKKYKKIKKESME